MAVDLTAKKSDAISAVVDLAPLAIAFAAKLQEFNAFVTDSGFLTGGGNAIADNDCIGANSHMTAADFNNAMTALNSITLSTQNKTFLRKVEKKPVALGT